MQAYRGFESLPLRQVLPKAFRLLGFLQYQALATPDWYTRVVHMALAMTRPWKHPKTGIFWLRRRIPKDLVDLLGKREEKRSLGTRDPAEAKRRLVQVLAEVDSAWVVLRSRTSSSAPSTASACSSLTERDADRRAEWMYNFWLRKHRDNPSEQIFWRTDLFERLWGEPSTPLTDTLNTAVTLKQVRDEVKARDLADWCLGEADLLLEVHNLVVDETSRVKLAKALASAVQRASLELARWAKGGFTDDRDRKIANLGTLEDRRTTPSPISATKFGDLFDGWSAEKRPAERTLYEWRRVLRELESFLGHDDAVRLTADDLIRWKSKMVEAGRRPKTIRDGRLAPIRAVLQWAVDNRRLVVNPAERISIDVQQKAGEKIRSFTDEEAVLVLAAAAKEGDPVRRWVPWLCAYTGARVSEICQLRAEDIRQIEGIWAIKFDPDAGPLKNKNSERAVPIHSALIETGFLDFTSDVGAGPLFRHLSPDKFGKRGGNGTKILGRWVRSLGLKDPRISPNHSWRHRFKTSGRR